VSNRFLFIDHRFAYPEIPACLGGVLGAEARHFADDTAYDWGERLPAYTRAPQPGLPAGKLEAYLLNFVLTRARWYRIRDRLCNNRHNDWGAAVLRNQAMAFLNYAIGYLEKEQPKFVLFSRLPHTGIDYAFWTAADVCGMARLFFLQSRFPYRFMLCDAMEDIGRLSHRASLRSEAPVRIDRTAHHDWFYMRPAKKKSLAEKIMERPFHKSVARGAQIAVQKWTEITSLRNRAMAAQAKAHQRQYEWNVARYARRPGREELRQPYVYFAFHLEPESSTLPRAHPYSDQMLALEQLSCKCPLDWKIFAKENPKQNFYGRDAYFFERLKALENVTFVAGDYPAGTLIENAKIVASVNGTVGWEAICAGKPALFFGHPWYRELPGAFAFSSNMDFADLARRQHDHAELERRVALLKSKMPRGVIFKKYEALCADFERQQNTLDAARDIALFLDKNGYLD